MQLLKTLLKADIQAFIQNHKGDDPRTLALRKPPDDGWPWRDVINQIHSLQKAERKIPLWLEENLPLIWPNADLIEQASSQATALFKAELVKGRVFCDLTAGLGVDSWAFSRRFEKGVAVDADAQHAALLSHNLDLLSHCEVDIVNKSAENYISEMPEVDFAYIDPQRRTKTQGRNFRLEDSQPNILEILPELLNRAQTIMLKAAPLLDINQAVRSLKDVSEVYILETNNQCREILYILKKKEAASTYDQIQVTAITLDIKGKATHRMVFTHQEEQNCRAAIAQPKAFLYEPGPALLKAGAFNLIAKRYDLEKLHPHTHLYTSDALASSFPGRVFEILDVTAIQKKFVTYEKAHLTIRNFPGTVADLRQKLKLREGGDIYLFACTLENGKKALIHTKPCTPAP